MVKALKILALLVSSVLALMLLALVVLANWMSPERVKTQLSQLVQQKTGRVLTVSGLDWFLFPWVGLQLNKIQLGNDATFGPQPFAQADRVLVRVKLLPLFSGKIQIDEATISGLKLMLIKNKQGVTNWQSMTTGNKAIVNANTPAVNSVKNSDPVNTKKDVLSNLSVTIASLNVINSEINWQDQQQNQSYAIQKLQVKSKGITLNQPFLTEVNFVFHAPQNKIDADIHVDEKINFSEEQGVSANGQLHVGNLQYDQFKVSNITVNNQWQNNILQIPSLSANLYQGVLQADGRMDLQKGFPVIVARVQLTNMQVEPLLAALGHNYSISPTGTANVNLQMTTYGKTGDTLLRNLNGTGQYSLANGLLRGIDIPYWLTTTKDLFKKHQINPAADTKQTDLGNLTGNLVITNGVLQNNDLLLQSKQFKVMGVGNINLVNQTLDYNISAQAIAANGQPNGVLLPLQITGPLTQISVRPMMGKMVESEVVRQLKDNPAEIKKAISSVIDKNLGKDAGAFLKKQLDGLRF